MSQDRRSEINRVFELQRARRWEIAKTGVEARREKLRRWKTAVIEHREEIARAIHADFRKHPTEVEVTEVHPVIDEINFAIKNLAGWMAPQRVKTPVSLWGTRSEIRYEPRGVCLIFAPWNYPFSLLANPLTAALAAGNCVVTKPSEKTPQLAACFEKLVRGLFDESEVAVVQGGAEAGDALLELPFDHIFFTGSTRIGKRVAEAAARHLTPVTLELGGKSPVILDEACDLDEAARRTVWGKFINAGQTCIAPDYVFVPRSRERAFLDAVKRWIASFYGATEEARKDNGDFCRLVDVGSFERIRGLVERSLSAGAHLEIGGRYDAESRYIAPTVLSGVRPEHAIMSEEIFGPVLPVLPFEDWREVYAYIQKGGKPLALYVFSNRADRTEEVIRETTAGGTAVNQALLHYANPHLPFGGTGESGQGSYHGFFGFKTFSHERAILRQRGPNLTRFLYPPYGTELQRKVLRALRRME